VIVKNGTYTGTGNRDLDFYGKAITLKSQEGPEFCVIDCEGRSSARHRGFYFYSGETQDSVIDGFTIKNGLTKFGGAILCEYSLKGESCPTIKNNSIIDNETYDYNGGDMGGGICARSCSPWILNNEIISNESGSGGGISCYGGCNARITGNRIIGNKASYEGGGIACTLQSSPTIFENTISGNWTERYGGGIYCMSSSPEIRNNRITENTASNDWEFGWGGGIGCYKSGKPKIIDNIISYNRALFDGGGIYGLTGCVLRIRYNIISNNTTDYDDGGGICLSDATAIIKNNVIKCNDAWDHGGGIYAEYRFNQVIKNNHIAGNSARKNGGGINLTTTSATISNNLIWGNRAENGAGVECFESSATISNTTIAMNTANGDGGALKCGTSSPIVMNSILWGNKPNQISRGSRFDSGARVTYSDIEGGYKGTGNINKNPLFVAPESGDFRLLQDPCQPGTKNHCIDAGNPASEMIEGSTRTDSVQDSGIIDMGYHYPVEIFTCSVECLNPVVGPGDMVNFQVTIDNLTCWNQKADATTNIYLCHDVFFEQDRHYSNIIFDPFQVITRTRTLVIPDQVPPNAQNCDLKYELIVIDENTGLEACRAICTFQIQD